MNKIKSSLILNVFTLIFLITTSGCGLSTIHLYSDESKFIQPAAPAPDETLLYLFREDTIVGGALGLTYVADDTVIGALSFGTFTYVKLPASKPYEIVAIWHEKFDEPRHHYRLNPSPGETVYIMFNKTLGERGEGLSTIDSEVAKQFMKEFKFRKLRIKNEKIGISYNKYFDTLITGGKEPLVIDNEKILLKRPFYDNNPE